MSHQYCWLCETDLSKRKKLHGDATKSTVKLLQSISLDYLGKDLARTSFVKGDYICHKCTSRIDKLDAYKRELYRTEKQVADKIENRIEIRIGSKRSDQG